MIVPFLFVIALVNALGEFPGHYGGTGLSIYSRIACSPVSVTDGQKGKISVSLHSITMNETSSEIPNVPIFILRLKDHHMFENTIASHFFMYETPYISIGRDYFEDQPDEFNITIKEEYANENIEYYDGILESSLWREERKSDISVSLDVSHSGLYCACILLKESVKKVKIDMEATNSYGHLPLPIYLENTQLRYYIFITSIVAGTSAFSLLIRKSTSNIIPVYYVLGVMLPTFLISVLRYSFNLLANHKQLYRQGAEPTFIQILSWLDSIERIISEFIFLLLAMGIGSLYHNNIANSYTDDQGRELPARLKTRALVLLFANIVFHGIRSLLSKYDRVAHRLFDYFDGVIEAHHISAYYFITPFIDFVDTAFPLLWVTLGLAYYVRTFWTIQRFKSTNDVKLVKAIRSFKLSIIFIFIIPIIAGTAFIALTIRQINSSGRSFDSDYRWRSPIGKILRADEKLYFDGNTHLLWVGYLSSIFTMFAVYFIWIANTSSPKTKDENELGSYNQIPLSNIDDRVD